MRLPIFNPRTYQLPLLSAMDSGILRIFALWHRRAGKDVCLWNMVIKKAYQKQGLYYYLLPTYSQAKKIIWDGIAFDENGVPIRFIDYCPNEITEKRNDQEMKITLINGSVIQLIGTDAYDAVRGTNPIGCVFSEYAFHNPMAWEVIKPILEINKGWAVFNTTPNGKNHAFDLWQMARESETWWTQKLTVDDTGILTKNDIKKIVYEGTTPEMAQQEYYVNFDIGTLGAYYSKQLEEAKNRICNVPIEKNYPVEAWFDLGKNDSTAILFTQQIGKEVRIMDSYESTGEDISHYLKVINDKKYIIGRLHLPHDATHKRMESQKTIEQQFKDGGYRTSIVEKSDIVNGINEVRRIFPRLWIDKERCKQFLRAIENYHKEYDPVKKVFKDNPLHDWSSNFADALRYLAIGLREVKKKQPKERSFDRYSPF